MADFEFRAWLLRLPLPARTRGRLIRRFGARIGRNVRVHQITVANPDWSNLSIGDDVYVGHDCIIDLTERVTLGRGSVLAAGVSLVTHQDAGTSHASPTALRLGTWARHLEVGPYAFIGTRAVLMADVGRDAIVGAGAVVVEPLPGGVTAVGVPARIVKGSVSLVSDPAMRSSEAL